MLQKIKRQIPNIMIGIGIAMLAGVLIYEGAQYPWKTLFAQWGWIGQPTQSDLGTPTPLPMEARDPGAATVISGLDETMIMQGEYLAPRPRMNLTELGVIKIPKIQITENIVEGAGAEMLYAVGHVRDTAMPGEEGNCVLAAHRLYVRMRPFRYLDKVEIGDQVYIEDDENIYTYEAFKIFEIYPDDTWVLKPSEEEDYLLTLLTCTPVVNPTRRLIVWCKLTDTQPVA